MNLASPSRPGKRAAGFIAHGKIQGNQRTARPVQQSDGQTMVTREQHPLPLVWFAVDVCRPFKPETLEPVLLLTGDLVQ